MNGKDRAEAAGILVSGGMMSHRLGAPPPRGRANF